jgi:hypothetical protein
MVRVISVERDICMFILSTIRLVALRAPISGWVFFAETQGRMIELSSALIMPIVAIVISFELVDVIGLRLVILKEPKEEKRETRKEERNQMSNMRSPRLDSDRGKRLMSSEVGYVCLVAAGES